MTKKWFFFLFCAITTCYSCDPSSESNSCDIFLNDISGLELKGNIHTGVYGPSTCINTYSANLIVMGFDAEYIQFELTNLDLDDTQILEYYYNCSVGGDNQNDIDLIYIQLYYDPILNFQDTTELIEKDVGGITNRGLYYIEFAYEPELCEGYYNSYFKALK